MSQPTAAFLIIGNEILSGRTRDANLPVLAERLGKKGIPLEEVRVVPDRFPAIIEAVNALRRAYSYVFTSGGIGPTHDDITADAMAEAFGRPIISHPEAERLLQQHYGDQITPTRLRMARMPEGSRLIANPVSSAPGFIVENVYVMAGVPSIFQAMVEMTVPGLQGGTILHSKVVSALMPESQLAEGLTAIQEAHPEVEIGSYPKLQQGRFGVSIVIRGKDIVGLEVVAAKVKALMSAFTREISDGELPF